MRNNVQLGLFLILLTVLGVLGYNVWLLETTPPERSYSAFVDDLRADRMVAVAIRGSEIRGHDRGGTEFITYSPDITAVMPLLDQKDVEVKVSPPPSPFTRVMGLVLLSMIAGGIWLMFSRRSTYGDNTIWKDKRFQIRTGPGETKTFADVAGIDEVQEELKEIVDFLKNHQKYNLLGGRIPKGVLLQGPPGTGKTLLARAIAGEASVPFYSIGGSDFVEMFAGVGASRVRELFGLAKKTAPCIVFIDEIDAIGSRRTSGGSNEEREQTLNALLVEMDGFSSNETVILIGATNRPDVLDPALLRPGRFDRQLTVSLPNLLGRVRILEVHTRQVAVSPGLNLTLIAQGIPGFSGADIANLVNEAALIAARRQKQAVEMDDFEDAKDKILLGIERRNAAINERERRVIAYHEAGHAIVAQLLPETDKLHKITIIPRGMAMGLTQQIPFEERYTYSLVYLLNRIKVLLGGRVAEKIVFNHLSTGAANDIAAATDIATRLVCEWGMSASLGSTVYRHKQHQFLGDIATRGDFSEATAREIDLEVRRIITDCTEETEKLLRSHNRLIHELAEVLLINETIDAEEINIVMQCYMSSVGGMQPDRTEQAVAVPSVAAVQPTRGIPV
ncbi:ATP-dependent zinc metalloprotease FtsH [Desulfoprunum benzoelyticum]|uniref:ATP-dependent zinc metalloprotease FtsH n=1 Tax=Desulfoprunum benzoelyticum TaxID=1506996 RepID=A0A840V3N4_9BACT|nr:ATP-dependent zinc metalloprotease FtsH [Desulfoprunum benzoelyticum]MBB5347731.1 cell division protease FtsH [Desulfoprunum benzoelyticum]MBM9529323.1 ATP-dependent zinc metalloprotease FtsH [Desulfoprunum benzoelyticum]